MVFRSSHPPTVPRISHSLHTTPHDHCHTTHSHRAPRSPIADDYHRQKHWRNCVTPNPHFRPPTRARPIVRPTHNCQINRFHSSAGLTNGLPWATQEIGQAPLVDSHLSDWESAVQQGQQTCILAPSEPGKRDWRALAFDGCGGAATVHRVKLSRPSSALRPREMVRGQLRAGAPTCRIFHSPHAVLPDRHSPHFPTPIRTFHLTAAPAGRVAYMHLRPECRS